MINKAKLYDEAFQYWGLRDQLGMLQEECGELVAASNQLLRSRITLDEFIEELADVYIMVEQMSAIVGSSKVEEAKQRKLSRLEKTIQKVKKEVKK